MVIYFVEGNISSGKSTLLNNIDGEVVNGKQVKVILEPLVKWIDNYKDEENNLLGYFYNDTNRWAFTFQMTVLMNRYNDILNSVKSNPDRILIFERSLYTDRRCFAENCYENGNINEIEWKVYIDWWNWFISEISHKIPLHKFIYLNADPKICYERKSSRARKEEENISLQYFQQLHDKHEKWLGKDNTENIIVLDGNGSEGAVKEELLKFIR